MYLGQLRYHYTLSIANFENVVFLFKFPSEDYILIIILPICSVLWGSIIFFRLNQITWHF